MKYYRTEKQRLYYDKVIALYRDKHMGKTRISKIIPVSDWTISNWTRVLSCRYRYLLFDFHEVEKTTSISFSSRLDYYHF